MSKLGSWKLSDSPARKEAATILDQGGSSPRENKNTLVFLAADRTRLGELDQAVRPPGRASRTISRASASTHGTFTSTSRA
jgi:hypothetical protein